LNDPVLVVQGLTVYRGLILAVQEVSFTVPAGTDTAIIGPNGAGKSTLIQAVLGILPRQGGQILVLGMLYRLRDTCPRRCDNRLLTCPRTFCSIAAFPSPCPNWWAWVGIALGRNCLGSVRARRQAVRASPD
jgi:zinc transport system ATP-binding protein